MGNNWQRNEEVMPAKWKYDYFTDKFRYIPEQMQLVCTGTTQAHFALDFSGYKIRSFNMAVWLNHFTYSELLLRKYRHRIARHAVVLITIQYPIFLCGRVCSFTQDNALQYSKILFGKDPDVSVIRQCGYRMLPDCVWSKEDFSTIKSMELRNRKVNHYKIWELEKLAENVIHAWEKEIKCDDLRMCGNQLTKYYKDTMEASIRYVIAIIDFCRENEWVPVLLTLPFSRIMNDRIPESFKENCFYRCIDEIIKQRGCCLLDYAQDVQMEDIHYYMDVWWLNERGRKKFTKIVWEDLNRERGKMTEDESVYQL